VTVPTVLGTAPLPALTLTLLILLSACSVGPRYERPRLNLPAAWHSAADAREAWPSPGWWRAFGSPRLDQLISQAESGNLDVAAAVARIREADALVSVAGAALLPSAGLAGSASRARSPSTAASGLRGGTNQTLFEGQLSASYEIDFWGANRASLDAARETAQASRFDEETVALTTVASVATTYFQILELRDLIATIEANLRDAQSVLKALEAQQAAGTVAALDVAQQETTVATLQAEIPPLQQQLQQFIDALAVLIGQPPEKLDVTSGSLASLSHPVVAPGLPSALLMRRPDVAMAEAQLKAANANITVARAAFFPAIQLTAQGGFESTALSTLFGPAGFAYALAAGFTQPIFEGGRLEGEYRYSKAFYEELLQDYRKSVIAAFQDVEDSLAATRRTAETEQRQQAAVDAAQRAYDITIAELHAGTVNVLTVLSTETALFAAETALVQDKLARLNASVSLFRALGGGWIQTGGSGA
jgi:outer membrane protein, multidrug efflux system